MRSGERWGARHYNLLRRWQWSYCRLNSILSRSLASRLRPGVSLVLPRLLGIGVRVCELERHSLFRDNGRVSFFSNLIPFHTNSVLLVYSFIPSSHHNLYLKNMTIYTH